jgi:hypothetical protein
VIVAWSLGLDWTSRRNPWDVEEEEEEELIVLIVQAIMDKV